MTSAARFVTFEGGEGAGKTTQIKRLGERLTAAGERVLLTREPGGSPGAEAIRTLVVSGDPTRWDAMTEALLMLSARRDHVRRTIDPALSDGQWVLCDRFHDSTVAYQGYGGGVPLSDLATLYRIAIGSLQPTLTLILDLPVAEGLERARARSDLRPGGRREDRFERMGTKFHEQLRSAFLKIAEAEPARCVIIDASPDADTVHAAIAAVVSERLGVRL